MNHDTPPGAHVHMPEVEWPNRGPVFRADRSRPTMLDDLFFAPPDPADFAVGQVWRTRHGEERRIMVLPRSSNYPAGGPLVTYGNAIRGCYSYSPERWHLPDGRHLSDADFDLVERVHFPRPRAWPWLETLFVLIILALVGITIKAALQSGGRP